MKINNHHSRFDTLKMVFRQIGSLLVLLGLTMVIPLIVSLIYGELSSSLGFVISSVICIVTGFSLYKGFHTSVEPLHRHALIIAALGWLSVAIMGGLPFMITAYITPAELAEHFCPPWTE